MLIEWLNNLHPAYKSLILFAIITTLAFVIPTVKDPLDVGGILTATSIFYSILLGFYIAAAMANLSRLKTLVAAETGSLIYTYRAAKIAAPQKADDIKEAIDKYVIKRFDYEIADYAQPSTDAYYAVFQPLNDVKVSSEGDNAFMSYISAAMYYGEQARRETSIVGARIVNKASWFILIALSSITVLVLFLMRDGTPTSALINSLLATAAFGVLFLLDDVDSNRFGEEQFAIRAYEYVFADIGKLPYFSDLYLKARRFKPTVAIYRRGSSRNIITPQASTSLRSDQPLAFDPSKTSANS